MDHKTVAWAGHETFKLINCVRIHPVLYDNLHYTQNRFIKEKLWSLIADKLPGKTAQNCKLKWAALKSQFFHNLKSDKLVKWPFYAKLSFLRPFGQKNDATVENHDLTITPNALNPHQHPSTSSLINQHRMSLKVGDVKSLMPECRKRAREEIRAKSNYRQTRNEPKTEKLAMLFERIEKDILTLPDHEQIDFEIQVMTILRDKLKKYGTNG